MNNQTLASLIIHLRPLSAGTISQYAGYLAHAAFFDLLEQVDPLLSQILHDANRRKPFTLSTLLELNNLSAVAVQGTIRVQSTRLYQLRLTTLSSVIFETFMQRFLCLDASNIKLRLANIEFQVVRIEAGTGSGWVKRSSFIELLKLPVSQSWNFQFASPTVFSLGEQDWGGRKFVLLPEPGQLFDSLANGWNKFAPTELEIDAPALRQYVDKYVVVTNHRLQTASVQFNHHQQLGFVGESGYRLMEKQPSPVMLETLSVLARFAFFAGVGYKTTMGMGQTRLIERG